MTTFEPHRLALGLALAGCAGLTQAAGFALIEQNASGLGNAFAGQAASAQDASTIFFNPAGLTLLPDRQVVMAGHLIKPQAEFSGSSTIGGNDGGDAGGLAFVPNAYLAYRLTPDLTAGMGMNAPFGLKTEYDSGWLGRTQGIKSELKTININPSLGWKATPTFSLGAGLSIQYAEATLSNATNATFPPNSIGVVKGDDVSWGFNLGALWQVTPGTRVGLAYRSEVDHTLKGDLKINGSTAVDPVYADVVLPDSASLSVVHKLNSRWELLADVTWTGWSDFKELRIVNAAGSPVALTIENWKDSYRYSAGANYRMNEKLSLRGGVAYDETPVSDAFRTVRIPDQSRTWLAFGVQYQLSNKTALDMGYAHLFVKDAQINKTESGVTVSGKYDASVDILSAQLTHSF